MTYPGNPQLSSDAQERVLSAFRRAITLLQGGNRREATIALDFTLRLDPDFEPARNLSNQLSTGSGEIDLASMISELGLPTEQEIQAKLVDAVDDFNERRLTEARNKVEAVLRELPGSQEARRLLAQIDQALKTEANIGELLTRAHQDLAAGRAGQAAELVMKAQAIDPDHPGIAPLLHEIQAMAPAGGQPPLAPVPPASSDRSGFTPDQPQSVEFAVPEAGDGVHNVPATGGFETLPEGAPLFGDAEAFTPAFEFESPEEPGAGAAPSPGQSTETGERTPSPGDDLADLFDQDASAPGPAETVPAAPEGERAGRVTELRRQGQEAFDREDYLEAIDIWSRIYLIDPDNQEASTAIDEARKRQDEIDRAIEQRIFEAQEAATAGNTATALDIVHEILTAHPDNLAAHQLEETLTRQEAVSPPPAPTGAASNEETPQAPGTPSVPEASRADIDADLFDATPTETPSPSPEEAASVSAGAAPSEPSPEDTAPARRTLRFGGMRLVLLGVGAAIIVAIGLWFGSKLMSGSHTGVEAGSANRVLAQAEALYKKGQPEKAIRLLESFHAANVDQVRIARRLTKYRKALIPPTPTPPPESSAEARQAFAAGNWIEAYRIASRGLTKHPGDPGLTTLSTTILEKEKQIGPLIEAEQQGDYETAVGIARELVAHHPDHPEFKHDLARDLFNLAVNDLRSYNLTGASNQLHSLLAMDPSDHEARRVLKFIEKYQIRPADMRLKVFIGSLSYR